MKRRSLLCFASFLLVAGCGGGGDDGAIDPGASSVVAARSNLASDGTSAVLVQWATPLDISAKRIIEYQVFRDDRRIGAVGKDVRGFRDTTVEGDFTYQRIEDNGATLTPDTSKHTRPKIGEAARYQVRVIFLRVEASGVTTFGESILNTPGVLATPLVRSTVTSISPQSAEALVRFPRRDGADLYQVELSASADFRNKTMRGPITVTNADGFVSVPWPTDSKSGNLVYCRVGARSTRDASPPLSIDPNSDDFIYSFTLTAVRP